MKRVWRHESIAEVSLLRDILERAGIACLIRNEQLSGALGEIPFLECQPELCVLEDTDAERAAHIIADWLAPVEGTADWRCHACAEDNDAQFAACWNCGATDTEHDPDPSAPYPR